MPIKLTATAQRNDAPTITIEIDGESITPALIEASLPGLLAAAVKLEAGLVAAGYKAPPPAVVQSGGNGRGKKPMLTLDQRDGLTWLRIHPPYLADKEARNKQAGKIKDAVKSITRAAPSFIGKDDAQKLGLAPHYALPIKDTALLPQIMALPIFANYEKPTDTPLPAPQTPPSDSGQLADFETGKLMRQLHAVGQKLYAKQWDKKRGEFVKALTKGQHTSATQLTADQLCYLIDEMQKRLAPSA